MRLSNLRPVTACALLLALVCSAAGSADDATHTGWMSLVKGAKDDTVGVQMVNIEDGDTADTQKITLAIPKKAIGNPEDIENIVVVGRRPEKPEKPMPQKITYEWVDDYDSDNYGLVIRLGKDTNWPIRLYLNSAPGYIP